MSEKSIQRLKNKFILTAMLSFFFVMLFMGGCLYLGNAMITRHQIKENIKYIAENDGILPVEYESLSTGDHGSIDKVVSDNDDFISSLQDIFGTVGEYTSDEFYYSTRYFAVLYDESGDVENVITSHTAEVDAESAVVYANTVMGRWFDFGSYDKYYYYVTERDSGGQIVVVMDCSNQIKVSRRLVLLACILVGCGMLISAAVITAWAEKLVQPEIKNAELQKSFITNASHELKTPLAVIKANTEMLEMMGTENEWTKSTMRQVDRMTGLIQNLVLVTKASERDIKEDRVYTDFSSIVLDTAKNFEPVATQDGKSLEIHVTDNIGMPAQEGDIRQLATLLVDNAIKYCDTGGKIVVTLNTNKKKKNIFFRVSNSYESGAGIDYNRFFDRFYRGDEAHNIDKEGYGVGLSIAQSLMERYHGEIKVAWEDGVITFSCIF